MKKNLCETPFADVGSIYNVDFYSFLEKATKPYDIIFLDPPYDADYYIPALEKICENHLLSDNGVIVMESKSGQVPPCAEGLEVIKEKKYGHTSVTILKKMGE